MRQYALDFLHRIAQLTNLVVVLDVRHARIQLSVNDVVSYFHQFLQWLDSISHVEIDHNHQKQQRQQDKQKHGDAIEIAQGVNSFTRHNRHQYPLGVLHRLIEQKTFLAIDEEPFWFLIILDTIQDFVDQALSITSITCAQLKEEIVFHNAASVRMGHVFAIAVDDEAV